MSPVLHFLCPFLILVFLVTNYNAVISTPSWEALNVVFVPVMILSFCSNSFLDLVNSLSYMHIALSFSLFEFLMYGLFSSLQLSDLF